VPKAEATIFFKSEVFILGSILKFTFIFAHASCLQYVQPIYLTEKQKTGSFRVCRAMG